MEKNRIVTHLIRQAHIHLAHMICREPQLPLRNVHVYTRRFRHSTGVIR